MIPRIGFPIPAPGDFSAGALDLRDHPGQGIDTPCQLFVTGGIQFGHDKSFMQRYGPKIAQRFVS